MEVVDTKTAKFSMLEKDILYVVMKDDAIVDIPECIENYEATMQLTKGNRYAVLVDARHYVVLTNEARAYSSQPSQQTYTIAQAVVIASLANRLLANFLIQFHKRNKNAEMKLFNDFDLASNWLKEKIKEEQENINKLKKTKKIPFLAASLFVL